MRIRRQSRRRVAGHSPGAAGPGEPEVAGLLALIRLHRPYRRPVRTPGRLVLLRHQDRSRWNRGGISTAIGCYATSAGPHQATSNPPCKGGVEVSACRRGSCPNK
ncbi:DUF6596 domain-containing protein [Micromonospora purpureochromogenes]|uniref:DUF6596 domain-containing protein n=1 Tax=Micromonospora purpureochromogenes TaxID=47872 RepID=UPI0028055CF1|nr:DUF6596 domain-containing protein [Micromonospora purpureochromogenes]